MTVSLGAGLGATLGFALEGTVGTFQTPTHFMTFQKESLAFKKNTVQSHALHGGLFDLSTRRAFVTQTVDGAIDTDLYDRGQGLLWQLALGAAPIITGSTVFTQTYVPGTVAGQSLTIQVGRPQVNTTLTPFSFTGCKFTDWTLSVATGGIAELSFNVDGWTESVSSSYAAPSYVANNMLHFAEATLIQGGTPSTSGGICTLAGGTTIATCKDISMKGTDALATGRYFLGANGIKAEQIDNNFRALTGSATIEFNNLTDAYNTFRNDLPTSMQLTFVGPVISDTTHSQVQMLIPRVYFDTGDPTVQGPDILNQPVAFTGLDDGTNAPVQVQLITLDSGV